MKKAKQQLKNIFETLCIYNAYLKNPIISIMRLKNNMDNFAGWKKWHKMSLSVTIWKAKDMTKKLKQVKLISVKTIINKKCAFLRTYKAYLALHTWREYNYADILGII